MSNKIDLFNLLRKITFEPKLSQREMAKELGFSLGKLNYCLKALNQKSLIKINNFKQNKDRLTHLRKYVLTKKGLDHRVSLSLEFMKKKINEYEELKKEIKSKN